MFLITTKLIKAADFHKEQDLIEVKQKYYSVFFHIVFQEKTVHEQCERRGHCYNGKDSIRKLLIRYNRPT